MLNEPDIAVGRNRERELPGGEVEREGYGRKLAGWVENQTRGRLFIIPEAVSGELAEIVGRLISLSKLEIGLDELGVVGTIQSRRRWWGQG